MVNKFAYDSFATMLENEMIITKRKDPCVKVTKMPRSKIFRVKAVGHYGRRNDGWAIFNRWKKLWITQAGSHLFHGDENAEAEWANLPIHVYGNRIEVDLVYFL